MNRKDIKQIKEEIVDNFLKNKWRPNLAYCHGLNSRGQRIFSRDTDNHLVSPSGRYAVRIKDHVLTLHDSKRSYSKILSMKFSETEILEDGLKCGCLILIYDDNCIDDSECSNI
jgi:hypothetical protein